MENKNSKAASGGISGLTLLTIAFVILKLCKVIGWSWWWVLSPTLIPLAVGIIALIIAAIMYLKRQ